MRKPIQTGGFTLVEVVVSISVLSLILLATVAALRTFANTQSSLERMTERVDDMRVVSSLLRDLVAATTLGESSDGLTLGGGAQTSAYMRGDEGQLVWRTSLLFGEQFGGQYLVRLAGENGQLMLRWREASGDLSQVDWNRAQSKGVAGNLNSLRFSYRENSAKDWQGRWQAAGPPDLIRVQIEAGGRFWPELIMRVPR